MRVDTPSSHHNIFPHKILPKGWVAKKPFFDRYFDGGAQTFQGLGPKIPESCDGNRVYAWHVGARRPVASRAISSRSFLLISGKDEGGHGNGGLLNNRSFS